MHNTGIYEIRNLVNGKRYIGSAVHFRYRWGKHLSELKRGVHHSSHLQRAWNRYGESSFSFHKLIICDRKNLLMYEQTCMDAYKPEYNVRKKANSNLGIKKSPEAIAKFVKSRRANGGWGHSEETRNKISESLKGRPGRKPSPESLEKMRAVQKAMVRPWMQDVWNRKVGVPRAQEVRVKLSKAVAKFSDEQVRLIRQKYKDGALQKELAEEFGVTGSSISELVRGVTYAWVI